MKKIVLYLLPFIMPAFLTSCVKETPDEGPTGNKNIVLHIGLAGDASRTRALTDDAAVSDVYLFAFEQVDGEYVYAYTPKINSWTTEKINLTARSSENKQLLLVVANARTEALRVIPQYGETLDAISRRLEIALADKWPAEGASRPIPMCVIAGDLTIKEDTKSLGSSASPYWLVRMLARFDVTLNSTLTADWSLEEVFLYRPGKSGWLVYNNTAAYWDAIANPPHAKKAHARTVTVFPEHGNDKYRYPTASDNKVNLKNTVYTFETKATSEKLKTTAIVVGLKKTGETDLRYYRIDVKKDTYGDPVTLYEADVVRNHLYDITINSVTGDGEEDEDTAYAGNDGLRIFMEVTPWTPVGVNVNPREVKLNVDKLSATLNDHNRARFYFWSNQPVDSVKVLPKGSLLATGMSAPNQFTVSDLFDVATTYDVATGDGFVDVTFDPDNTNVNVRDYYLDLYASSLIRRLKVSVTSRNGLPAGKKYVGTFHTSYQRGERLIAMANTGDWSAEVEDPTGSGSFVVLAPGKTLDPYVWTNAVPTAAEAYPVEGDAKSVTGTGNLFFRVGLTGTIDLEQTRYARIKVTTTGETFYLYVRQGDYADYLIHPDDVGGASKNYVKKVSPYNLTARDLNDQSPYVQVYKQGQGIHGNTFSQFTTYPTQAGAFFQWAGGAGYERRAYHPTLGIGSVISTSYNNSLSWEAIKADHETCPEGYRRPKSSATAAQSEFILSLLSNPSSMTHNSSWGYYADGFFDRLPIHNSLSGTENSAAGSETQIAYMGRLFFNNLPGSPREHASVFFPAVGMRNSTAMPGLLDLTGRSGYYWSSEPNTDAGARALLFTDTTVGPTDQGARNAGFAIRCVKDE